MKVTRDLLSPVILASMDIASGPHWSKPSDFKGEAEGNLLSQAWLGLPSSLPLQGDSEPSLTHGQCPDRPARLNQRYSSTSLSPSSSSCNSDCSYLKTEIWSSLKLKESNKDIEVLPLRVNRIGSLIEALPFRVNRIDALLKKNKKLEWKKRGLRLVIHPDFWQALMVGSDGKSPPVTKVLRTNGSSLILEHWGKNSSIFFLLNIPGKLASLSVCI